MAVSDTDLFVGAMPANSRLVNVCTRPTGNNASSGAILQGIACGNQLVNRIVRIAKYGSCAAKILLRAFWFSPWRFVTLINVIRRDNFINHLFS